MVRAPACSEDIRAEVAELLGVGVDAVQTADNLISQGLDSIRMMSLAGRWRRQGIDVDFAALSATPTIEAWSELVVLGADSQAAADDSPEDRDPRYVERSRGPDAPRDAPTALQVSALFEDVQVVAHAVGRSDVELDTDLADGRRVSVLPRGSLDERKDFARSFAKHFDPP